MQTSTFYPVTSYPGSQWGKGRDWYTLFAHAPKFECKVGPQAMLRT